MIRTIDDSDRENDDSGLPEWDKLPETQIVEIPKEPVQPTLPPSLIDDILRNGIRTNIFRLPEINNPSGKGNSMN